MTQRTRVLFCDLLNLPRGKYVPGDVAAGGSIGFARGVFGTTFDRDLIPVPGAGVFDGIPDMELVLDGARRPDWQAGTEIALGTLHVDGAPFELCARGRLQATVAAWQARGFGPKVGLELEAYVFQQDADGVWTPYDTPGAFVYGTGPQNDHAHLHAGALRRHAHEPSRPFARTPVRTRHAWPHGLRAAPYRPRPALLPAVHALPEDGSNPLRKDRSLRKQPAPPSRQFVVRTHVSPPGLVEIRTSSRLPSAEPNRSQAQGVGYDRDGGEAHGRSRNHR